MKLKVLFVDDDENILNGFRAMLHSKRKEWKCSFSSTPKDGLNLVKQEKFDVVLADMRMPCMDGADFLKAVEEIQPRAVRIILSGYSESQSLLKSVKNAHQFLSKPCNSDTITGTIERVMELQPIITDESIKAIVTRLDSLPALPDLYIQIKKELESPDPDLKQVAKYVEQDVGMSATLMKLVNSSFFGFYDTITSPARAVILLGVDALKGLVLSVNLFKQLRPRELHGFSVKKLWSHSLETGGLAKVIAACETDDKNFISNCFAAGLLHDIGKLIFATQMNSNYRPVLDDVRQNGGPVSTVEEQSLNVTHAEIGAYLLGLWGFNETIVEGVHSHHMLARCDTGFGPAIAVHVANALQHELAPQISDHRFSQIDMDRLRSLNLHHRLDLWREKCSKWLEDIHGND